MQGKIVKAVSDFYYIFYEGEIFQCKAKGLFKQKKITPLVGDLVEFDLTNSKDIEGNVTEILPRKSELKRPPVANIDKMLIVFALKDPEPNFYLLDRFLAIMENSEIEVVLVFNKTDLESIETANRYKSIYENVGYKCLLSCIKEGVGISEIKSEITGFTTGVAGPSGVGKSSLINALAGNDIMETGDVSHKNKRGKQTTRHTELIPVSENTFIVDTPGFSSTDIDSIDIENLAFCFPEFKPYLGNCKFSSCSHDKEPGCAVRSALDDNKIQMARYESFIQMYKELKDIKRF